MKAHVSILPSHGYILHTQARTPSGIQKLAKPTVQYLTIQSPDVTVTNRGLFLFRAGGSRRSCLPSTPNCLPLHLTHVPHHNNNNNDNPMHLGSATAGGLVPNWSVWGGEFCFRTPTSVRNSPRFRSPVKFPPSSKVPVCVKTPRCQKHTCFAFFKTRQTLDVLRTEFVLLLTKAGVCGETRRWMRSSCILFAGRAMSVCVCMDHRQELCWMVVKRSARSPCVRNEE